MPSNRDILPPPRFYPNRWIVGLLGQDAFSRLKKNRWAWNSGILLLALLVIAFMTPVLPLQSPIHGDLQDRRFESPNFRVQRLVQTTELGFPDDSLRAAFRQYQEQLSALDERVAQADSNTVREALIQERRRMAETLNPLNKLWHHPSATTQLLLRTRLLLFGESCLPSIFGCDDQGRDVLARVFWGSRVSLTVGLVAALVSLLIGVTYGAVAGFAGGWVDSLMMRLVDTLYSIPFIFVVIFLITLLDAEEWKNTLATWNIDRTAIFYVMIGAIYWLTMARVVRGQVLSLKTESFVEAATAIGFPRRRILFLHLLPNTMGVVLVYLTLTIPSVILFEAFLSFLGMGVSPPDVSWGLLVNEGLQVITPIETKWWIAAFPSLVMSVTLLALNFLGDGLRDALDPKLKGR